MDEDGLRRALSVLSSGGVVAAATETFFGLLADAGRSDAIDRVFALKGRDADKGVALVLPNRDAWAPLVVEIPSLAGRLADRFWPGPLTIALEARRENDSGLDRRLVVDGSIAVRWPAASDAAQLAAVFGRPLTATSANRTGAPPCASRDEVERCFEEAVRAGRLWVLPGQAPGGSPSTLVTVTRDRVRIVRRGRIEESEIRGVVPASALR